MAGLTPICVLQDGCKEHTKRKGARHSKLWKSSSESISSHKSLTGSKCMCSALSHWYCDCGHLKKDGVGGEKSLRENTGVLPQESSWRFKASYKV